MVALSIDYDNSICRIIALIFGHFLYDSHLWLPKTFLN